LRLAALRSLFMGVKTGSALLLGEPIEKKI